MALPDLDAWAVFAAVAEDGSLTRAAARLGVSKATISKALARLERRLGAPLFHRTSRRITLTAGGQIALPRAQRLLAEAEAAEADVSDRAPAPSGRVRMTAPVSFGVRRLGPLLPGFLARYPAVSLDVQLSDRRVDLVAAGLDLALRIGDLPPSSLRGRRLFGVRRRLVAAPAYLARHGAPAHPAELPRHAAILFTQSDAPGALRLVHAVEGAVAVTLQGRLHADNADLALPLLLVGEALALMPDFTIDAALAAGTLVELLPGWSAGESGVHLLTPPGAVRAARVAVLIDYLAAGLRPLPEG